MPEDLSLLATTGTADERDDWIRFLRAGVPAEATVRNNPRVQLRSLTGRDPIIVPRRIYESDSSSDDEDDGRGDPMAHLMRHLQGRPGLFQTIGHLIPQVMHSQQRGLSKEVMEALPESTLIEDGEDCVICLETMSAGERVLRLPCFHSYHSGCVRNWLGNAKCCPIDKINIEDLLKRSSDSQLSRF